MEGKKKKRELSVLEKNQNRTRSDLESEQVGWIALVRATRCEVHCWAPREKGYGGYSGNGALLHHNSSKG